MKVLTNSVSNVSFSGLVPKKDYKGPLLNLTKADKEKIAVLKENIDQLEFELYHFCKFCEYKKRKTILPDYYFETMDKLRIRIEELKELIREIKINRMNKQKGE